MIDFLYIVIGLVLLVFGGDFLLKAAVDFSYKLKIPKIVIGMTVVSFATSAPELIVSIKSALEGHADLALGNVIGSNIANIALVLGVTVLITKINVAKGFMQSDWLFMMLSSLLLFGVLTVNGEIGLYTGILFVALLIGFLFYQFKFKKSDLEEETEDNESLPLLKSFMFLVLGGFGLWAGSELLINGATGLATDLGVSERVIAVTVVSIGTSIPELAASVIAAIKKEKSISLGNLIGSNIFNILAVLGITSIVQPVVAQDQRLLNSDIYWMLGVAAILIPLILIPKKMELGKKEGIILLLTYGAFVYMTL
ncbi:calcium/sodium antiporter [Aureivirga sp. CE67]|uniref:calcium/sodium antiporter n=1 Tax=Aureivirga sp. CE67 TaxID=1788983 RepID=UPI0018CB0DE5|nr:calcium/sodium antiporter [Aureivirga sp. CE67]